MLCFLSAEEGLRISRSFSFFEIEETTARCFFEDLLVLKDVIAPWFSSTVL